MVVVDPEGNVVGDIPNLNGAHGAALVPEFHRGYITNGRANSVTIFDLKSLQTIKELPLPAVQNPDGYLYDSASKHVFTFNQRSHDATAIDAMTDQVVGRSRLTANPKERGPMAWAVSSSISRTIVTSSCSIRKPSRYSTVGRYPAKNPQAWPLMLSTSGSSRVPNQANDGGSGLHYGESGRQRTDWG